MTTTKDTKHTKLISPSPLWGEGRGEVRSLLLVLLGLAALLAFSGCTTLDRAYHKQVTWANAPVVQVMTNTVVTTNLVPQVIARTNVVLVTNAATGGITGYATRSPREIAGAGVSTGPGSIISRGEPVATNLVTVLLTNIVPVFQTNFIAVPVTNLVARSEVETAIQGAGLAVNTFAPGIGSILALVLGGLYHGYRQVRNRRVNEALIQGVETARAVLETTPQGQAADAQLVKWLMTHQKEAGVFTTVSTLVDDLSDNPAAKLTAQEIIERVQRAQGQASGN